MEDILKSKILESEKNFWYNVGAKIQSRVKGIVQVFYNKTDNSVVIKIFFEKFNYSISTVFPRYKLFEMTEVINQILDGIKYRVYEEIFK